MLQICCSKKYIFNCLLNTDTELYSRIVTGRVFEMVGATTEKACFASSVFDFVTVTWGATELLNDHSLTGGRSRPVKYSGFESAHS